MQPAHQQFPVRVLFCLTFFFALQKGWVELLLLALLFITLSMVIFYLNMNKVAIVIWCWKKILSILDLARSTHTNVCILISFNTVSFFLSFLLSRRFSLSLTSDEVWNSEILQVAKFDRLLRSSTSDIRQLRAREGPSLCQFFRSCSQIALLFEVIFAMLGHFFVVGRVACGVLFLSSTTIWKSRPRTQTSFRSRLDLQVEERPCQYCHL